MKLTWTNLSRAKPGATFPDPRVPGLRYRVRPGGIFAEYRYKLGGKWQAKALGRLPTEAELDELEHAAYTAAYRQRLDFGESERDAEQGARDAVSSRLDLALAAVRKAAAGESGKVRSGQDPRGSTSPNSLRALIDRYLVHAVSSLRPRTQLESRRHLLKHWAPLHERPAAGITKAEIAEHLLRLKAESGPVAALRSRATLRALYSWAFDADLVPNGPAAFFPSKRVVAVREQSRERVLTMDELRAIWSAADPACDYGVIVRLLMLTGQRREEVGGMRWSELDLERGLWSLPGERTKNGRPHVVSLSRQALELLRGVERKPDRDNLFGNGRGSYSGWSRSKRRLDGRTKIAPWTLHDLRRSFETHLTEDAEHEGLEIDPYIADAILNHIGADKAGVAGIYNRAGYRQRAARAMQLWADYLLGADPAKVIPLRA